MNSFHTKLKRLRMARDISQINMARFLGMARQTYLDLERGKTEPRLDTFIDVCKILDVSYDYFLDNNAKNEQDRELMCLFSTSQLLSEVDRRHKKLESSLRRKPKRAS